MNSLIYLLVNMVSDGTFLRLLNEFGKKNLAEGTLPKHLGEFIGIPYLFLHRVSCDSFFPLEKFTFIQGSKFDNVLVT